MLKKKNYNSINHSGFAYFGNTCGICRYYGTATANANGEQPQGDMNVSIPFTDVASDAWYYNVVSQAYGKGLISGISDIEFSPESSVTGAQLIMMLYRADDNTFSEQTSGNWL